MFVGVFVVIREEGPAGVLHLFDRKWIGDELHHTMYRGRNAVRARVASRCTIAVGLVLAVIALATR